MFTFDESAKNEVQQTSLVLRYSCLLLTSIFGTFTKKENNCLNLSLLQMFQIPIQPDKMIVSHIAERNFLTFLGHKHSRIVAFLSGEWAEHACTCAYLKPNRGRAHLASIPLNSVVPSLSPFLLLVRKRKGSQIFMEKEVYNRIV